MRRFFTGILKTNAGSKPPWRTPEHPPYSEMVEVALRALSEEGGSTESSISAYIESTFTDLPWGHDRLLPYYLRKLVISGEISSPTQDHYILSLHHHRLLSSAHSLIGRRGRHPIYLPNPRSHPSFKSPPFASPRRQGRSRVSRFRGKRPEIFAECTPMLHLDQGSAPPRRRRGRPPLQRGGAVGGAIRMSVPRTRRPRGSRISQNGGRGRKPSNNGDCADNPDCFELIHGQSLPGKLQSILPPGPDFSSEILVLSNGKKDLCSETCALQPMQDERGEGRRLVASPQPEHGEGQLFAVSVLSEHGEGKFSEVIEVPLLTLEPEMVSYCPSLEHSEHNEGNSSQREAPASTVLEQTEPSEDQTSPGEQSTLLSLEKPENDGRCSEIPENDGHGPEMLENHDHDPKKAGNDVHDLEKPGNNDKALEKPGNDNNDHEKPKNYGHDPEKPENNGHCPEKSDHGLEKPENDDCSPDKSENDGSGPDKSENDGSDFENPENDGRGLEKPENDDCSPENPENDGSDFENPENDGRGPEKPENDDCSPENPENDSSDFENPENDGRGPNKPENYGHGPEKHENDGHCPEKHENDAHGPAMPENDAHGPAMPENDVHGPAMPENDVHGPAMPENDVHGPAMPENDVHGPAMPENDYHGPAMPENDVHGPTMPENDVNGHAMSENDDHDLEKPEEDHDKCSPGKRTAMVALDQEALVSLLLPGPDEVGSSGASNKKKRSHGKRRRLKLWFEG